MKIHNKRKGVFSTSNSQAWSFNWRMSFFIGNAEGFFSAVQSAMFSGLALSRTLKPPFYLFN